MRTLRAHFLAHLLAHFLEQAFNVLPTGAFTVRTVCSAHAINNVTLHATGGKRVSGDVHAVAYTCSLPRQQMLLQRGSEQLTSRCDMILGEPNAVWQEMRSDILEHTLFRTSAIKGGNGNNR